jgi:penicillin-binding protein-related factor A (putative recombinase)
MRNSGKPSEQIFEDYFASLGKRAYLHRLVDAAEVRGRTGKVGQIRPAPADYIVTCDGQTFYAEVKSTTHETRFSLSLLRTSQSAAAKQVLAAGGDYFVYIHSIARNEWFKAPYRSLQLLKQQGVSSVKWCDLSWSQTRIDISPT